MAASALGRFVHRLAVAGDSDGELVGRFVGARSEAAFAELVRRYGPAVFGVCRRALGDHHLAEDAFQAVFVVLARKAHTIRPPGAVGGWLYGVARKAAAEAAAMRRRKNRESLPGTLPDQPGAAAEPDDTAAVVDAEIADLPPIFRAAVLLCEIEGVSRAEAAARLGIAPGTLSSRLAAARKLLAERLRRRGVAALAVGAGAAVPERLARAAASRVNGEASGVVRELLHGVLRTMLVSKLKLTPVAVACAALAGVLWVASVEAPLRAKDAPPPAPAGPQKAPAPAPVAAKPSAWKELFTLEHTARVTAVAASKELIVVADAKPSLWLWDAQTGKESDLDYRRAGMNNSYHYLRFTDTDGYFVASAKGAACRFRPRSGGYATEVLSSYDLLACSADLNTLLVRRTDGFEGKPNQLFLHVNPWVVPDNILKHLAVFEVECEAVTHADVSANDRRVAVAGDDAVIRVYNRDNLRLLHKIKLPKETKITSVRLSADGGRLAVVGEAGFAKLFDAAGTEVCDLKGHEGTVAAVAFAPDGKQVVTAAGKSVRVFDAADGKPVTELAGHKDIVTAVAFSTDGKRIVSGSADKTAKVWERKE